MVRRSVLFMGMLCSVLNYASVNAATTVTFEATDEPGSWYDCSKNGFVNGYGCVPEAVAGTGEKSLALLNVGDSVAFQSTGQAKTLHTAVSLLFPTGAGNMPFDTDLVPPALNGDGKPFTVQLNTPGLYVFFCDIHPYMFAGVIVDDSNTTGLDLGATVDLPSVTAGGIAGLPTTSDLALRLVRTFFIVTNPNNWQQFPEHGVKDWLPTYPAVPVLAGATPVANLSDFLHGYFKEPKKLHAPVKPHHPGVGQVWVDTQFEKMKEKTKPGTATAINASSFHVMRKVGLPTAFNGEGLNNPHNMWTDKDQKVIYQTEWFDNRVTVFDRHSGKFLKSYDFGVNGPAPAHVMTRMTSDPAHKDDVHVSINGGNDVAEFTPLAAGFNLSRYIPMGNTPDEPVHPHAHWMSADGGMMVTPNEDADNSSLYTFQNNTLQQTTTTGHMPIATGMMPDSSKYYVANFADSTISVITIVNGQPSAPTNINLLANYNPITGAITGNGAVGGLPIQTPVSPDGKYVITANTLTATLTVIDTATDTVIGMLPCDPGCHGVQFGAKRGGGYYAYVSSKFSNRLLVVDLDHIKSGHFDTAVVGSILLAHGHGRGAAMDGTISDYAGMGGQGVLPIPVVYNGWVQQLPPPYLHQLTPKQRNPIGPYGDHSHDGPGHP